jgi:hypothetical protein
MARNARDIAATVCIVAASVACVGSVRARVVDMHAHVKETSDVHLLPPPREVAVMSFGYRAALADLLWAHVLVTQGLRMQERRRFDNIVELIDTINELDPTFREPYMLSDALITLQSTSLEDAKRTRVILERGLQNRPLDADLWRTAGQFVAFIVPGTYLKDQAERDAWRADGARMLAHAAELGGDEGYSGWAAVASAGILRRQGERDAAIRLIKRTLAVTEDEELRDNLEKQLALLVGEQDKDAYLRRRRDFFALSMRDLPWVKPTTLYVLGPPFDAAYCAGGAHADEQRCALTWKAWAAAGSAEKP